MFDQGEMFAWWWWKVIGTGGCFIRVILCGLSIFIANILAVLPVEPVGLTLTNAEMQIGNHSHWLGCPLLLPTLKM